MRVLHVQLMDLDENITASFKDSNFAKLILRKTFVNLTLQPKGGHAHYYTPQPIGKEHDDILLYIGGSIIRKVQKKAHLCMPDTKIGRLQILESLLSEEQFGLVKSKSRGGLRQPLLIMLPILIEFEKKFRLLQSDLSFGTYFQSLKSTDCFTSFLYILEDFDKSQCVPVIYQFVFLFHKFRAHHQCKLIIQTYRWTAKNPGFNKGLRKELEPLHE